MNLDFTERQEMLRAAAKDFIVNECPKSLVRELEEDEKGYSPELWQKIADLGWLGLVFPEEYGGAGGDFMDLVVLLEEMGRGLFVSPILPTVVIGGLSILNAGSEEQKQELLPRIASGELIISWAFNEFETSYDITSINTRAIQSGANYTVEGTKLFVGNANICDYLLTVAKTDTSGNFENGLTTFLIPSKQPGVVCTLVPTIAFDSQYEVVFHEAEVPEGGILGGLNGGWQVKERALLRGAAAKCAEMIGGAEAVLEMATAYAKERIQYERPIGSFQVIQHYLANMWIDVLTAKNITYKAAWKLSHGLPCKQEVASAKGWVSQVYNRVAERGIHIHGAIGLTEDHDISLHYKRAKAAELAFGDLDYQQELMAREIGL